MPLAPPRRSPFAAGRPVLALAALSLCAAFGWHSGGSAQARLERPIGPGTRLLQWTDEAGPFACQAVEVDLREPLLRLGVSLGGSETLALEPLSAQAERLSTPERYAIAGVNGDFFHYPGQRQPGAPTSAAFLGEELVRTPFNRSCLVLPASGPPDIRIYRTAAEVTLPAGESLRLDGVNQIRGAASLVLYTPRWGGTTRADGTGVEVFLAPESFPLRAGQTHSARVRAVQVNVGDGGIQSGAWVLSGSGPSAAALKALAPGDTLRLRVAFDPPVAPGDQILGGGPRLIRNGVPGVEREGGSLGDAFAKTRHPRTAVGFNRERLFLFVADGRQPGYSAGMTLDELAGAMLALGCTEAVNLDGGGSSTLWVRGKVTNRPSDGRERPVANGLLVYSTAPRGEAVRLVGPDGGLRLLAGAEAPLSVTGEDRHYNPIPVAPEGLRWEAPPGLGSLRDGRFQARSEAPVDGAASVQGAIQVSGNGASGSIPVTVYFRPARLDLRPATQRLAPQSEAVFRVRALDPAGAMLGLPTVTWSADPAIGAIGPDGTLRTAGPGRGVVRVTVNGVTAEATVEVAEGVRAALDDFEERNDWLARLSPGALGQVRVVEGRARSGKRALRLDYNLSAGAGTRAVYAQARRELGRPFALKVWVYGDGQGVWLRARVRDARGGSHMVDLARRVDWKDEWREVRAAFSDDLPTPLILEALYVVEADPAARPQGALLLDDLTVEE
jgi:hypothetical protein